VIKGVGVVAGGPFWCAKADSDDFMNGFTLPILTATGPCMSGPPPQMSIFFAKADAKSASGDIDPLQNVSRQKIYAFHGYNDAWWRGRSPMRLSSLSPLSRRGQPRQPLLPDQRSGPGIRW